MNQSPETIRADFDRIAPFSNGGWNHNSHYHPFLLRHVPEHCGHALDIGCGTGGFARQLASRSDHVLALDLSPEMIRIARDRWRYVPNIDFQVGDAMAWPLGSERFDCVASIATLHHLPLPEMLSKIGVALKPGGVLVVLDLFKSHGIADLLTSAVAVPVHWAWRLLKRGYQRRSAEEREAWAQHAPHESYLALPEVRRACSAELPGARVRKHLLWRYSIVWQKPRA